MKPLRGFLTISSNLLLYPAQQFSIEIYFFVNLENLEADLVV